MNRNVTRMKRAGQCIVCAQPQGIGAPVVSTKGQIACLGCYGGFHGEHARWQTYLKMSREEVKARVAKRLGVPITDL